VDKATLERFRNLLMEERKRVLGELDYLEQNYVGKTPRDASSGSAYSMHPADMGTDSSEVEKAYLIGAAGGALLEEIDDALRKVDRGEYGSCEHCGKAIPFDRLEAVPYARDCVTCRTEAEKSSGGTA
jgi:RNA polymerase-binding protein DksA